MRIILASALTIPLLAASSFGSTADPTIHYCAHFPVGHGEAEHMEEVGQEWYGLNGPTGGFVVSLRALPPGYTPVGATTIENSPIVVACTTSPPPSWSRERKPFEEFRYFHFSYSRK